MSFNRENTIWQSPDGTWNRGFYEVFEMGSAFDEDHDPEWDVEYGGDFWWVTIGHPTLESAHKAWDGANPGGYDELPYDEAAANAIAELDLAAQRVIQNGEKWGVRTWAKH